MHLSQITINIQSRSTFRRREHVILVIILQDSLGAEHARLRSFAHTELHFHQLRIASNPMPHMDKSVINTSDDPQSRLDRPVIKVDVLEAPTGNARIEAPQEPIVLFVHPDEPEPELAPGSEILVRIESRCVYYVTTTGDQVRVVHAVDDRKIKLQK